MRPLKRFATRPSRFSTRSFLFAFVAAVLIPVLLFAGLLIARQAQDERARYEANAIQTARQVALIVESEITGFVFLLRGLATSRALAGDDLATFYDQAKRLVVGRDETIVLRQLEPRQLLNTSRPFDEPLPPAVPLSAEDLAHFKSGRWLVSNVYLSPTGGDPRIAVALPIMREEGPRYILAITLPTTRIRDALIPALAADWIVTVADRTGTMVARSAQYDEFSGKSGRTDILAKMLGRSGTFRTEGREGTLVLTGYYRSDQTGWLFGANIPETAVAAPLRHSLTWLIAAGAAAVAISCLLAYLVGSTFVKSIAGLAARATALGQGRAVEPMSSHLAEFVLVSEALAEAGTAIEHRARERDKSDQQRHLLINELDHRVKNTLAMVQSIVQQTLRTQGATQHAGEAVTSRLISLARVHDVLTRESWEGANLHEIVVDIASAQGGADKIRGNGPPVWLSPALALSLSLALNELRTNAIKYGALSRDHGFVDLEWSVTDQSDGQRLVLRWSEHGGPTVLQPAREGFGMRLLQRSLSLSLGGDVRVDFKPQGLICTIEAAIPSNMKATEPA